jgi:phosphatidylethanolamine-binding protein (PEBP) family uncharacterized protein
VVVGLGLSACADDGRDLAAAQPWQTTTTRPPPPTSALDQETGETGVALTSPAFEAGADIPVSATCAGDNVFPDLAWSGVPQNAVELAITLSDQTEPEEPLLLWLMAGISPTNTGLAAGTMPVGAFETLNDYGNPGYGTPCLDTLASGRRDLQFRLHVMTEPSGIAPGDPGNEAWATVRSRSVDSASLLARIDSQG